MLSKSRYLKGLKCHKALWLNHHKKEEAFYSESTKQVFNQGNTAGELAQQYFPGGELALVDGYPNSKAIAKTQSLIANGITTIYEATFAAENTLVAVDILHQIEGKWHAFEVKSTNSEKEEHIRDAAIQYYVMTHAGIIIEDISILHFDRNYVRQGNIVPKQLFTYVSVFDRMQKYLQEIPANIATFLSVYQKEEPKILIGDHCNNPYGCEFLSYCQKLPENKQLLEKEEQSTLLSTAINYKDERGIQAFLTKNPYPIYSLDFESIQYGIPEFDTSRPYQQIAFQYSLHVQKNLNSVPEHFEYLGNGKDDPREDLIKQLIADCGDSGSILMYSHFEKTIINQLIRDFPKYKIPLQNIINRLVDLGVVFRKYLKTEMTKNTWSLKVVLPTFLPQFSYQELDIQNGMETMNVYRSLTNLNEIETQIARKNMLAYCKLDTEAVLALYTKLYTL